MKIYEELQQQYNKYHNIQNLMKHFNVQELSNKCKSLKNKAPGIDRVTKYEYMENLEDNIYKLYSSIRNNTFMPTKTRRCYIPKSNGKFRPLGIPAFEDRIVQGVMSDILVSIYELIFLDCSYGYRLNRNCHTALSALKQITKNGKTNYIVKADIKGFFDNVCHSKLIDELKLVIQDKHFISLVYKYLKADIFYKGKTLHNKRGTPQGRTYFSCVRQCISTFSYR